MVWFDWTYDSRQKKSCLSKLELGFWIYGLIKLSDTSNSNLVSRLQTPTFFLSLYLTNLTMIGLDFSVRCVRSISASVIDNSRCSFIVAKHKSSVFSFLFSGIPYNNKQSRLEYCSYLLFINLTRKTIYSLWHVN